MKNQVSNILNQTEKLQQKRLGNVKKSYLQNDEINMLKKLANVPFNNKLVRKVARKELLAKVKVRKRKKNRIKRKRNEPMIVAKVVVKKKIQRKKVC